MDVAATMGMFRLGEDARYAQVDAGWLHLHQ